MYVSTSTAELDSAKKRIFRGKWKGVHGLLNGLFHFRTGLVVCALSTILATSAKSQTSTKWVGGGLGGGLTWPPNWSDSANWSSGLIPVSGATTRVSIVDAGPRAGTTPTSYQDISSVFELGALTFDLPGTGTFALGGGVFGLGTQSVPHDLAVVQNSAWTVTIDNGVGDPSFYGTLRGTLRVSGSGSGPLVFTRSIDVNVTKSGNGSLILTGPTSVRNFSVNEGSVIVSGSWTIDPYFEAMLSIGTITGSTASFSMAGGISGMGVFIGGQGTFNQSGGIVSPKYFGIGDRGTYNLSGGYLWLSTNQSLTVSGVLNQSGGEIRLENLVIYAAGRYIMTGGSLYQSTLGEARNDGSLLITGSGALSCGKSSGGFVGLGTTTVTGGGRLSLERFYGHHAFRLSNPPTGGSALTLGFDTASGSTNTIPIVDGPDGPGGITIRAGEVRFNAINTYTGATIAESGGLNAGAAVSGVGRVAGLVWLKTGSVISPAGTTYSPTAGTFEVGALFMAPGAIYSVNINGPGVGQSDILEVYPGGATVSGASLQLNVVGSIPLGSSFPVLTVDNGGPNNPIQGSFFNAPQGSVIQAGGNFFAVDYFGGDGNDLTLTAVPPSAAGFKHGTR